MTKILGIDDKQDNLIALSAVLKNLIPGCIVITAQSGAQGIKKAIAELPDTIILDIKMPRMDGFEVCKILKSADKTKHIPVIMLTAARTDAKSRIKGLNLGADAFLGKPIDESELAAQVNVMLRIKKAEDILRKEKDLLEETVQERTEAVRRALKDWEEIVEAIGQPTLILDPQHGVISANRAAVGATGKSKEALLGMKCYEIMHGTDQPPEGCPMEKLFTSGHFETVEMQVEALGGVFLVSCTPLFDDEGNLEKVIHIATDITERKRAEEEKKKLEMQLQQAQKMEAIGTLAGGIAHDFNNILVCIMGYTEMSLYQVPKGTEAHEFLHHVLHASYRAKDLVKQILTFSRQSQHEPKPVQISIIVKEVIKLLRASLPATIELRQNIEAPSGSILADPIQIHQVLMNLCMNAAHAMREKGGVLDVRLAEVDIEPGSADRYPDMKPGSYLRLTVSDTGHGMNHDVQDRIFDPYFTTKDKDEGTGLGLAVVHGIVKSLGGTIIVDSKPGKGTTFQVFFPRIETKLKLHVEISASLPRGHECILFVDDEEPLADMWWRMLEHLGYEVVVKTSSIEALEIFRSQPDKFDLVITDQTMPKMTGVDLARELLRIRPDIPIILCTGFSEVVTPEKAKAMGIREFVMKPMVMRDMAETIRRVIEPQ